MPHAAFRNRILSRTMVIWLGMRMVLLILSPLMGEPVIRVPFLAATAIALIAGALTILDATRHNELFILSNLGIPTSTVHFLALTPPALLELLIWVAPLS